MGTSFEQESYALALGRIPSGLYVVTTLRGGAPVAFVGSFIMQMGFSPPTICVAIGKSRPHLADIRESGRFTVSILDKQSSRLMKPFLKPPADGTSPFAGIATLSTESGVPALADALAWIGCRVTGEYATPDHTVVFAEIVEGALLRDGEPAVHLRKNGLSY